MITYYVNTNKDRKFVICFSKKTDLTNKKSKGRLDEFNQPKPSLCTCVIICPGGSSPDDLRIGLALNKVNSKVVGACVAIGRRSV